MLFGFVLSKTRIIELRFFLVTGFVIHIMVFFLGKFAMLLLLSVESFLSLFLLIPHLFDSVRVLSEAQRVHAGALLD